MKDFIFFVSTDPTEIFFSKLRSAGLNYSLPCIFTDSYCAGGGGGGGGGGGVGGESNQHCLLTFFIYTDFNSYFKNTSTYLCLLD